MTTTSPSAAPSTSPGRHGPALVSASCAATVTSAQRVAAAHPTVEVVRYEGGGAVPLQIGVE